MSRVAHVGAIASLVLLVGYVFRPALDHGPRADHLCVLTDTFNEDRFWPLVKKLYSYNRTRQVFGGDYPLFRPLLFTLIAAEKAAFGHDFFWWQLTSLLTHLAILLLTLSILFRLHRLFGGGPLFDPLAYALVFFFAVNPAVVEMVIWHHINGYMLFLLFTFGAFRLVLSNLRFRIPLAWILLLLAAFTHEIGQYHAVLVGVVLGLSAWREDRRRDALILVTTFSLILGAYQLANHLDRKARPNEFADEMDLIVRNATLERSARNAGKYLHYTTVQPFFPSANAPIFGVRVHVRYQSMERLLTSDPAHLVSAAVLAMVVLLTLTSRPTFPQWRLALLPLSVLGLHLGTTVIGRMNVHPGFDVLENNSYYTYFPLLLGIIALGTFWAGVRTGITLRALLVAGLGVLTIIGAGKTRTLNIEGRRSMHALARGTRALVRFVREQRSDPHFRLSFHPDSVAHLGIFYWVPLTVTLFHNCIDHDNPSHVAVIERGILRALPVAEYRRRFPDSDTSKLSTLVRVGTTHNVFRCRGEYFALRYDDGWYQTDREIYRELIQGASLEDVLKELESRGVR